MTRRVAPARTASRRSPAEWITLAVSSLVLLAMAALLIHADVSTSEGAARFSATLLLDRSHAADGRHHVPVEVRNDGPRHAEEVRVRVRAEGEEPVEFVIDYLAAGQGREAVVVLPFDPRAVETTVSVVSYLSP